MGATHPLALIAVRWGLPLAVTGGLLLAVGSVVDGAQLQGLLGEARPAGVVVAAGAVPIQVALAATRWRATSRGLGMALPARKAFAETGLATLLNQLLPSGVAGEAVRIWRQRGGDRATALVIAAALADRGLGFVAFVAGLALSLLVWPVVHPGTPPGLPVAAAVAVVGVGGGLLVVPSVVPGLPRVVGAMRRAVADPRHTGLLAGTSVAFLAAVLAQAHLCAWTLGLPGGLDLLTLLPLYLASMLVPLTVGGWGPKEVAAIGLFPLVGWSAAQSAAFSALFGLTTLLGAAGFAVVALISRRS